MSITRTFLKCQKWSAMWKSCRSDIDFEGRLIAAVSTGRRNILFSNNREGDVDYEVQTEDL